MGRHSLSIPVQPSLQPMQVRISSSRPSASLAGRKGSASRAGHGHQIGLAGSDDVFGGLAVADPAHHGDGYAGADGPLDRGGAIGVPAVRTLAGGMMYSTDSPMPMETFSMSTPLSAMTLAMRTACSMSMPPGMNSSML